MWTRLAIAGIEKRLPSYREQTHHAAQHLTLSQDDYIICGAQGKLKMQGCLSKKN